MLERITAHGILRSTIGTEIGVKGNCRVGPMAHQHSATAEFDEMVGQGPPSIYSAIEKNASMGGTHL